MSELPAAVAAWRDRGGYEHFRGRQIYVQRRLGEGPLLVLMHGFPSSSYDFAGLLERLERGGLGNSLCFDFLGFGLSDKPREQIYSLLWQADLAEQLIARHRGDRPVLLVAHDMGTSVVTELLARDLSGRLGFSPDAALLFNGSIVLDQASLTWPQRLLRSPLGPIAAQLSNRRLFRRQFGGLFSAAHPLEREEEEAQWALLSRAGGHRLGDRLVHYLGERERYTGRWHGAISNWPGELRLGWGLRDPVATGAVLAALRELRPQAPVSEWPELGHYPQIEDPDQVAKSLLEGFGPLL